MPVRGSPGPVFCWVGAVAEGSVSGLPTIRSEVAKEPISCDLRSHQMNARLARRLIEALVALSIEPQTGHAAAVDPLTHDDHSVLLDSGH